ncbi:MAG: ABC transporter permease [Xanthomonadales bacterium]|nr:ABC transporter permease [Xanthomonadales bacterium]NIN60433.1 ABC transporter permease [Xanthomonadales bacterium]NIN75786.1 ABC transporter permease [Xanthomonadales bacterium]NIO12964.1 ABC transporter permease [Xanthomonadales bacterium]NIP12826.1 ABC transporter permease [Xanthomonadales bacterium]
MSGLGIVFRKEVRENLRDRKAVFNSLLLGPILFPILFIGLAWFSASKQMERAEQVLEVPVVGAEHAASLVAFLEQQGMVVQPAPADPERAVRQQEVPVVIRIPDRFGEQWAAGEPAVVEVIADPSRRASEIPMRRVKGLLNAYSRQIGFLRLQLRGVSPSLAVPVMVKDVDLSTPRSRALLLMIFLPYLLMITAFTGGMHLAIDSTAGEKERGSLEPLLINPVPRWQIMSGKMAATTLFAFASLTLTLLAFRFALPFMPTGALGIDLSLRMQTIGRILLAIAPVALLAAALLTLLATYARSFREAQSYMGLVILIPMIPSILFMANPVKPETAMMAIPIFAQNLLIGEIVRGESVPWHWLGLSSGGTLLVGLALAAFAATLFNRSRVMFPGS